MKRESYQSTYTLGFLLNKLSAYVKLHVNEFIYKESDISFSATKYSVLQMVNVFRTDVTENLLQKPISKLFLSVGRSTSTELCSLI